ncbi:hypothetical protein AAMO2058_000821600 [Amorphochlora amoebiformis]
MQDALSKAAKAVVSAPFLTLGVWGDGKKPQSIASIATSPKQSTSMTTTETTNGVTISPLSSSEPEGGKQIKNMFSLGIMIVPQAALYCKLRGSKELRYHNQMGKAEAENLYKRFIDEVVVQLEIDLGLTKNKAKKKNIVSKEPPVPPQEIFKQGNWQGQFKDYDEKGFPTAMANGDEISKRLLKKITRVFESQKKKWEKNRSRTPFTQENKISQQPPPLDKTKKEPAGICKGREAHRGGSKMIGRVKVVFGTFGNRQGLRLDSELGPFSHVFNFGCFGDKNYKDHHATCREHIKPEMLGRVFVEPEKTNQQQMGLSGVDHASGDPLMDTPRTYKKRQALRSNERVITELSRFWFTCPHVILPSKKGKKLKPIKKKPQDSSDDSSPELSPETSPPASPRAEKEPIELISKATYYNIFLKIAKISASHYSEFLRNLYNQERKLFDGKSKVNDLHYYGASRPGEGAALLVGPGVLTKMSMQSPINLPKNYIGMTPRARLLYSCSSRDLDEFFIAEGKQKNFKILYKRLSQLARKGGGELCLPLAPCDVIRLFGARGSETVCDGLPGLFILPILFRLNKTLTVTMQRRNLMVNRSSSNIKIRFRRGSFGSSTMRRSVGNEFEGGHEQTRHHQRKNKKYFALQTAWRALVADNPKTPGRDHSSN